jgi:hypothetical protein
MAAAPQGSDSMRMWGALHKFHRLRAGLSHAEVAQHVGYSPSLVVSIERGVRMPSPTYVTNSDHITKADGALTEAARHLSRQQHTVVAEDLPEEEGRARAIWTYDTHVLHPLLRTEAYARAIWWAQRPVLPEDEIEARVAAQRERQAHLLSGATCSYAFIVEENVLRRRIGDREAMHAQLDHLVTLSTLRNVTLQVMPAALEAHTGLSGPITLLRGPEHTWLAHIELHSAHHLIHDADHLATLHDRYTHLRSLALTPADTLTLIHHMTNEPSR